MRKIVYVAVIGSRSLPKELFEKAVTLTNKRIWNLLYQKAKEELRLGDKYHNELTKEQQTLVNKKTDEYTLVIRSGNAIGMDQVAYQIKRANLVQIYSPYANHNRHLIPKDNKVKSIVSGNDRSVDGIIDDYISWYGGMKDQFKVYPRRDYHIINGFDKNAPHVDLVVMYGIEKNGRISGGTYYGYKFATVKHIQVHNIYDDLHAPDLNNVEVAVEPTKKYTGTLTELLGDSINQEELLKFWSK